MSQFSCNEDQVDLADFCCACAYPLPCICEKCRDAHCSKPSSLNHRLFPIAAKTEITSARDLMMVQHRLQRLDLTYNELWKVFGTFQKLREDIEATFQEISYRMTEIRNGYLTQVNLAAELYERRINEAMQDNYSNSWRVRDFAPSDPFAALIWTHEPGKEVDFDLQYQLDERKDLLEQLCKVSWVFPFPGFPSYPEYTFPLKLMLDSDDLKSVLVQPHLSIAEVKTRVKGELKALPEDLYLVGEGGVLQTDWSIESCRLSSASRLRLTSKITLNITTATWESIRLIVDLNSSVHDLLANIPRDEQHVPMEEYILYGEKWLEGGSALARCGLTDEATVRVVRKVIEPFAFIVHMPGGKTQTINVENSSVLTSTVKQVINEAQKLTSELYSLTYKEQVMEDTLALSFYSVQGDVNLSLAPLNNEELHIQFQSNDMRTIDLTVNKWNTVEEVRAKLRGMSVTASSLICKGKQLQGSRYFISYADISNQSTLETLDICISIQLETGRCLTLQVSKSDNIASLRTRVQEKEGLMPNTYHLIFANQLLEDDQPLSAYNVLNESMLYLVMRWVEGIIIYVQTRSGERITIYMPSSDTIELLKARIWNKVGIPSERQRLSYNEKLLDDNKTLAVYDIANETTLLLHEMKFIRSPTSIEIYIKLLTDRTLTLDVNPSDSIRLVKDLIWEETGIHPHSQRLAFSGKLLEDGYTLAGCKVQNQSTLNLLLRLRGGYYVKVKLLNGRTVDLYFETPETVECIRTVAQTVRPDEQGYIRISEELKNRRLIPHDQHLLIYNGKRLEDSTTFRNYGIESMSKVEVILRHSYSINVQLVGGRQFLLQVEDYDSIPLVKTKIAAITGISPDNLQLTLGHCELQDENTLLTSGVKPNSTVMLRLVPSSPRLR